MAIGLIFPIMIQIIIEPHLEARSEQCLRRWKIINKTKKDKSMS